MKLLILFLVAVAAFGQSFDRLTLRPRAQSSTDYDPGAIRFYDSRWPATEAAIQYTGLQALDHESLERYTLTLPPAAATEDSCIIVAPDGTMSFVPLDAAGACKRGRYRLLGKYVGLGSKEDILSCPNCGSWDYERNEATAPAGIRPFWMESWVEPERSEFGTWMFPVPGGLSDPPIFWAYVYSSSGIGTNVMDFHVGCVTPSSLLAEDDDQGIISFGLVDFDDPNTNTLTPALAGRLHRLEVELVNHDDWNVGDLCLVAIKRTTPVGSVNITYFLEVGLE